jgi:hypothetical protein
MNTLPGTLQQALAPVSFWERYDHIIESCLHDLMFGQNRQDIMAGWAQVLSYYKIFGYPTGLGALIARKDALPLLRKRYFGGGTVTISVADGDFVR